MPCGPLFTYAGTGPVLHPIRTQPIPHLINRESVVLDNLMVITIRAGNRLRLRPLAVVRLVYLPRRVIHQLRQQIRVNRPRNIITGIHIPIQFAVPARPASNHPQVPPVQLRRGRVTKTHPQPDQVILESLAMLINESGKAQSSPSAMLDCSFHCSNRSASSPSVRRLYSSR